MEQRENDELMLAMRYSKCDRKGKKEGVKQVTRAGCEAKSLVGNPT